MKTEVTILHPGVKTPVTIRHPDREESLSCLWPALEKYAWNLEQVWVAVHGEIVGGLIVWDAGHEIVRMDNLIVLPSFQFQGVAYALLDAAVKDLLSRGRRVIVSTTSDVRMAYWSQKLGAGIGPAEHRIWFDL